VFAVDSSDPVASKAFFDALFPDYHAKKAQSVERTINLCVRLLGEGIERQTGIGPWYFDEARKVIAERDAGLTEVRPDPLRSIAP
jgi:hypothetical protein